MHKQPPPGPHAAAVAAAVVATAQSGGALWLAPWLTLSLALLAGPAAALALLLAGAAPAQALLLGITTGWWALSAIPALPIHFAPLLALLVLAMFSIAPMASLMRGFGLDAFWWILGSWMLALAAWESGLVGALFAPRAGLAGAACRLLAGLTGLPATRAAALLQPFARRDGRAGFAAFHVGRLIGLPAHALNLFALALLPLTSIERYTPFNWLLMTLPTGAALALLSTWLAAPAPPRPLAVSTLTVSALAPARLTPPQWLAALALLLAWLGAALGTLHGLPSGMCFLYLGLMTIAAGLLPLEKFWRGIDWLLLLALGLGIGLARIVAGALIPTLGAFFENAHGAPHPLALALALLGLSALGFRYLGLVRCALIALPLALALGSALGREPAGWLLMVSTTLHWLDICAAAPQATLAKPIILRGVRLAGLALVAATAALWYWQGAL